MRAERGFTTDKQVWDEYRKTLRTASNALLWPEELVVKGYALGTVFLDDDRIVQECKSREITGHDLLDFDFSDCYILDYYKLGNRSIIRFAGKEKK